MVAEGGDLVADTLKGVAEIASVDDKATRDGGAFGLIADELDVHNFYLRLDDLQFSIYFTIWLFDYLPLLYVNNSIAQLSNSKSTSFFVAVVVVDADEWAAEGKYLAEGNSSKFAICMTDALRHWAKATSPLKAETSFVFILFSSDICNPCLKAPHKKLAFLQMR